MSVPNSLVHRTAGWHRPMLFFAGLMVLMTLVSVGGLIVDDRVLLGAPIWLKPFKFAVSIALYCVTWSWLYSLLVKRRRLANLVSNVLIGILAAEYVILVLQVVRGRASHFNVSTPFDSALFSIMGVSIAGLWVGTLVLTVLVLSTRVEDTANRWAIRLGTVLSLIGMGLAGLMLGPTDAQLESMRENRFQGMVGAHSVGVEDGGPTMPVTGWSTTGGDLRIPHFVGIHALQALPLFAMVLGLLATRLPRLRPDRVRARLVWTAAGGYAGLLGLVTWQALRGQPLIHPDRITLTAFAVLVAAVALGTLASLYRPARPIEEPEKVALP
jgi:hypothetical protein